MKKLIKKTVLLLAFVLSIGMVARADSDFLSALGFTLLYPDNEIITTTKEKGISEKEYLDFLLSENKTLGEKVALVEALSVYFEFRQYDNNSKNDKGKDYFSKYTDSFIKKSMEKYPKNDANKKNGAELGLLGILMMDYQTTTPNINRYNQLADALPESLTAQSIRVIAYGYYILYNEQWGLVDKYENEYLKPYNSSWKKYQQDVKPEVTEKVNEWQRFIKQNRVRHD